jgi:hypothetical protein
MSLALARDFLLWCAIINYGVLLLWVVVLVLAHDWMRRFHGQLFHVSPEHFDAIHYAGMAIYKIGILLFNLAPYVALRIVIG